METFNMISESLSKRLSGINAKTPVPKDVIEDIIEWLVNIRIRPDMFFGEPPLEKLGALYWFHKAFVLLGFDTDPGCDIFNERGWRLNSFGYVPDMKKKGLSDSEIVQELLTIEILTWQKLLEKDNLSLVSQPEISNDVPSQTSDNG